MELIMVGLAIAFLAVLLGAVGLALAVLWWIFLLPFRILGFVLALLGAVLALPFVLIALLVAGLAAIAALLLPLAPLLLLGLGAWWLLRRSRAARAATP